VAGLVWGANPGWCEEEKSPTVALLVAGVEEAAHRNAFARGFSREYEGTAVLFRDALRIPEGRDEEILVKTLRQLPALALHSDTVQERLKADSILLVEIAVDKDTEMGGAWENTNMRRGDSTWEITARPVWQGAEGERSCRIGLGEMSARGGSLGKALERLGGDIARDLAGGILYARLLNVKHVVLNSESMCYHRRKCRHLPEDGIELERTEAVERGGRPCRLCFPRLRVIEQADEDKELTKAMNAYIASNYCISHDMEAIARVEKVGNRIVREAGLYSYPYVFNVVESQAINAFTTGEGFVYVTRGLLEILEYDDELALILGHEMAHVEQRHCAKEWRERSTARAASAILGALIDKKSVGDDMLLDFIGEIIIAGHNRDDELEADRLGAYFAARAGYSLDKGLFMARKLWDLEAWYAHGGASFLRSHPYWQARIEKLDEFEARMAAFEAIAEEAEVFDKGLADGIMALMVDERVDEKAADRYVTAARLLGG